MDLNWTELERGWRQHMHAGGRATGTVELRSAHLRAAARHLRKPPATVTTADLTDYLTARHWSPATMRSVRSSLRGAFEWAHAAGHIADDPTAGLPTVLQPRPVPHPASEAATNAALRTIDPRTRLMVELMALAGLRRGEVATMRGDAVTDRPGGPAIRVTGKGGHTRIVPIPGHVAAAIRARGAGWTFPGQIDGHLSPRRVGDLVRDVLPSGVTAHSLRHRYATAVYARTRDIRAVQALLGHARLDTTMVYVAVDDDATTRAAATAWQVAA